MIDDVKPRLGIFYSTPEKDAEIQGMIDAATLYFQGAGWRFGDPPGPLAREAVITYCKMAQHTDPTLLTNHPVLISFIIQGRAGGA